MTILAINENWRGDESTQELGAVRGSKRKLQIICDQWTPTDELRRDSRLPRDGVTHPTDPSQYCTNVSITAVDTTRTVFDVVATYSNDVDDQELEISKKGGTGEPPNPFDDPAEIEVSNSQRQVPLWADRTTGEVIRNAAGDIYDPGVTGLAVESVLRVTRNEADYTWLTHVAPWLWKVNETPFFGAAPGDVLCTAVNARRMFERGVRYWVVSREFTYRNWLDNTVPNADYIRADFTLATGADVTGWSQVIPNNGFYYLVDNPVGTLYENGKIMQTKARIKDSDGEDIQVAQFLNADGTLRKPDAQRKIKPIMIIVDPFKKADFNALNLGV